MIIRLKFFFFEFFLYYRLKRERIFLRGFAWGWGLIVFYIPYERGFLLMVSSDKRLLLESLGCGVISLAVGGLVVEDL